ncbi:MAG TPA: carbohydrate binding family 9 domain-containing protein [Pyrinomonadaceae bacterium]|nr:carbohydrate binding family 9 domain-containing protein [Pyrinomonadaceae bacterium]
MKNILALLFIFLLSAVISWAQTPSPTPVNDRSENPLMGSKPSSLTENPNSRYVKKDAPVRIPRFDAPPVIDGKLDDAVWQTAAVFGDFLQIQPGDNVAPTHPTEFMMGYDSKNLYMAYRIFQDKNTVRATVSRRDNIFNDDYVLVYIDTFNDQRQAYVIFFNPLGIQADGTFTEGRGEDYSVDLVFESKGVLTEDGFTIEAAIPFKSLRYEAGKNKQWGLSIFRRVKYKNNEYNSWMPINRNILGYLNQSGHITGLEGIETTRQLEINPSLTLSQSSRRSRHTFNNDPAGRFVNEGLEADFGFTAKFGLTPTITLDFAYNPDFAQVEADAPVSTANVRFPIFFPEKRPFFLERIDIFQSGLNIVNTRAIVDPDVAAKLTGRRGKNTFGIMYASDNAPGNYSKDEREDLLVCQRRRLTDPTVVCGIERFVDKNADIGVLRVKRDIGRQHNLGFFATTYNFIDRHNHTSGFDGRFRLSPKIATEFEILGTHTRGNFYDADLDRSLYRTGNGLGYRGFIERESRNLYMNLLATGKSRDYYTDVGFTGRTDTNYLGSYIQYETDRDAKKTIVSKRIINETSIRYDWLGRSQSWLSRIEGMLALHRQTFINAGVQFGYERVFEHEFGAKRRLGRQGAFFGPDSERSADSKDFYSYFSTTPNKQLSVFFLFSYTFGQLDYDLGAGPDFPRVSPAALLLGQDAPFDPGEGNQLTIESNVRYQPTTAFQTQLNYTKRRLVRNDTGLVAFDDNLFSSRSIYQFTRNTFARLRLDYSTLNKRIRPQFVLGWTPNPGTALYVGYNDDINYNSYNPFTRQFEPGFRGNGRTFFIKAAYLFRRSF